MADKDFSIYIKTCKSSEITDSEWSSYIYNFNKTFYKNFDLKYFKHKYLSTSDGYSFHSFLIDNNKNVVGACTLIPTLYKISGKERKIALAVDLFVLPEYRNDSLNFLKLYLNLKKIIAGVGIVAVIAIPNSNSYLYWKNVVKFKDVGTLSYWAYPVRLANITKRFSFLNQLSLIYAKICLSLNTIVSLAFNSKEKSSSYEIDVNEQFMNARFYGEYISIIDNDVSCYYKITDEDGVKTAYLIYARENGTTSYKALIKGVQMIMKKNKVDLILYIGTLRIFQLLFFRVPKKLEPKTLPLICDILTKENKEIYKDIYDLTNWDFGLLNYDVR